MAGPTIMALGPYQFEAMGFGFNRRVRTTDNTWATIPIAGRHAVSQWTGGEGVTETISGVVFKEFGGQAALEGIKIASTQGIPLPLVDLSGGLANVFGMQVVETIDEERNVFDADGAPLRNAYQLKLRAYQGGLGGFDFVSMISLLA